MRIRALAFDVFGTLVDWRSSVAEAFRRTKLADDPEELAVDWRNRLWPMLGDVNRGARPWGNLDELHRAMLDDLLDERGLTLPDDGRSELVQAWHQLDPWPDARPGLEALRAQQVTAALSNGHIAMLVDLARHGELRFDCVISAELAHVYKPQPEVYLTATRLLGLQPDELMLVAAHPIDLKGARNAGLRTAFIDRPLEYGPDSPPREDPDADVSVSQLQELATWLGR